MEPQNADKIVAALQEFGFDVPNLSPELFLREDQVVRMGVPPIRLELFTTIPGLDFEPCYGKKLTVRIDGVDVDLIDLENLKVNKRASGRPKDIDDLRNLP
jgi:hypothetical protein